MNLVNTRVTYYSDVISVYIPKTPFLTNYHLNDSRYSILDPNNPDDYYPQQESPEERSIRRTKKAIKDYILCNRFSIFATFTFADNRYDIDEKKKQISCWFKNQQKRNGKFEYLAIPEFHSDGALHFHVLMTNYSGRIAEAINPKTNKPVKLYGQQIYTFPEFTLGFSNFRKLVQTPEDYSRVASYVAKYITKEMPIFKNKKRYFASRGLKMPLIEDNPSEWYKNLKPDWEKETPNGRIVRFNRSSNNIVVELLLRTHELYDRRRTEEIY